MKKLILQSYQIYLTSTLSAPVQGGQLRCEGEVWWGESSVLSSSWSSHNLRPQQFYSSVTSSEVSHPPTACTQSNKRGATGSLVLLTKLGHFKFIGPDNKPGLWRIFAIFAEWGYPRCLNCLYLDLPKYRLDQFLFNFFKLKDCSPLWAVGPWWDLTVVANIA